MIQLAIVFLLACIECYGKNCNESQTTASGEWVFKEKYCKGDLIFEDNFDELNFRIWQHEISLTGSAVSFNSIKLI